MTDSGTPIRDTGTEENVDWRVSRLLDIAAQGATFEELQDAVDTLGEVWTLADCPAFCMDDWAGCAVRVRDRGAGWLLGAVRRDDGRWAAVVWGAGDGVDVVPRDIVTLDVAAPPMAPPGATPLGAKAISLFGMDRVVQMGGPTWVNEGGTWVQDGAELAGHDLVDVIRDSPAAWLGWRDDG